MNSIAKIAIFTLIFQYCCPPPLSYYIFKISIFVNKSKHSIFVNKSKHSGILNVDCIKGTSRLPATSLWAKEGVYKGGATHSRPCWFLCNILGELGVEEAHHMLTTEEINS